MSKLYEVEVVLCFAMEDADKAQALAEEVVDRGVDSFGYSFWSAIGLEYDVQRVGEVFD